MRLWMVLAAVGGLFSVAFGAFGAHGVADPKLQGWLRTGAEYGLAHCLAVFACALVFQMGGTRATLAAPLFLLGVVVFSGSLYAMALGGPRWFGAITPIGGLMFLAGWATLAWAASGVRQA
ncbi:MAG: DUF423 domain-containing protein [Alphaproteobacteria bacterium]|nr:DUF423 domain-containing protein [Alphaproteobacteria bacterium]MBU1512977.1 DUF423 domain-containing protein [Alphaproteobacteria bacterium]MBU2094849.1 DUF423 domain-containing protein [Alphaproteobacteria bacterium]MBU2152755.1 DUF423 domain-containing protein [Alphaproteobacteria bacterium]MBU2306336.1 DUF423 domain-containing protein [Alphaproteobacteria bacterium]